eukprot:9494310-Lingulodinium_polyedra.AAC.1
MGTRTERETGGTNRDTNGDTNGDTNSARIAHEKNVMFFFLREGWPKTGARANTTFSGPNRSCTCFAQSSCTGLGYLLGDVGRDWGTRARVGLFQTLVLHCWRPDCSTWCLTDMYARRLTH